MDTMVETDIRPNQRGLALKEAYERRELLYFLIWRDIKIRYKQTVLGVVWAVLVPVLQVEGASIKTIEGVATGQQLSAIQTAFIEHGGAQCGICTPGMVMAAINLLEEHPSPTDAEIREGLAGNLCRCTGYIKIFEAVLDACGKHEGTV